MKNFTKLFTVLTAACLMIASAAQATTSIGVNFQDPAGGPGGNQGPGGPDAVGGTAGVIPQPNWNDVGPGISGGPVGLIDNTAAATSATVTWTATQTWAAGGNATPNERLLNHFLDAGTGIPATITISALPATIGPYDVSFYIPPHHKCFVGAP